MSKVASTAASLGVTEEQLTSQLATIISVTRQAPESIGTALRSIYARMTDIESGTDDETSLGNYTKDMAELGVNVLDAQGKLRDMGEVIEEVGGKWSDYSREQQIALAQTMAGTRQFNNLIALFDNWDQYTSTLNEVNNAQGALQKQQDIYMESTKAHLNEMTAQWEDLFDSFLDTDTINAGADAIGFMVERLTNLVDALGGGGNTLLAFGSILTRVFNDQIVKSINTTVSNVQTGIQNIKNQRDQLELANQMANKDSGYDDITKEIAKMQQQYQKYEKYLTEAQKQELQNHIKNRQAILEQGEAWETAKKSLVDYYNNKIVATGVSDLSGGTITVEDFDKMDEDQLFNLQSALEEGESYYQGASEQVEKFKKALTSTSTAIKTHSMDSEQLNEAYGKIYKQLNNVIEALHDYTDSFEGESVEINNLKKLIDQYNDVKQSIINNPDYGENKLGEGLVKNEKAYKTLINLTNELSKAYSNSQQEAVNMNEVIVQAMAKVDGIISTNSSAASDFLKKLAQPKMIQGVADIGEGLASTLSTMETIKSFGSIWSNETLSGNEKMEQSLQSIVNIGVQVGMTASSVSSLATVLSTLFGIGTGAATLASGGLLVALPLLISGIGSLISGAKEAEKAQKEAFSNALNNISDTDNQLDELKSKIEQNKKQIQEIRDLGNLSITDESDITNLQLENKLLESKIALLQQQKELEEESAKETFEDNLDSSISDINKAQTATVYSGKAESAAYNQGRYTENLGSISDIAASDVEGFNKWKEQYVRKIAEIRSEAKKETDGLTKQELQSQADYLEESLREDTTAWQSLHTEYINTLSENMEKAKQYLSLNPDDEEAIKEAQLIIKNYYEAAGTYEDTVAQGLSEVIQENKDDWVALENSISSFNFENIKGSDFEGSLKGIIDNDDLFDALKEKANSLGLSLQDFFEPLANSEGEIVLKNIDSLIQQINNDAENGKDSISDYLSSIRDISDTIAKGGYVSLDKDQISSLNELEQEYSALGDIQDKNSHEYLESLRQIGELLEDNKRKELEAAKEAATARAKAALDSIKNLQKLADKQREAENSGIIEDTTSDYQVRISAETDKLQEAIKDALSAEYEIKVKLNAEDIKSDVQNAFAFSDEITNFAKYITDDLKISIDQAKEIVQAGYGGMLENAQATSDGMIQLSRAARDAFIDGKQQEVEASRQAYISQLEQEKVLVQAQIDSLDAELAAVQQAKSAQNKEEAQAALQNIQTYHNQYLGYVDQLNAQLQADNDYSHQAGLVYQSLEDYKRDSFETALLNQQQDESDATTQQAREINKRIQNLEKLYNSLVSIGKATKESATGPVTTKFSNGTATGGGGLVQSEDIENKEDVPSEDNDSNIDISTEFNPEDYIDKFNKNNNNEYLDALEDWEQSIQDERDGLEQLRDSLDAGITALEAAPNYVDTKQKNSGSGGTKKEKNEPDAKEVDLYNDRVDVFSTINEEIEAYDANLKALQNTEDQVYGKKYVDNLNKQLDIIEKLKEAQQERLDLANQQKQQLGQELTAAGFTFTDTGALDRSQLTAMKNAYDEDAKRYNAMSGSEQQSDAGLQLEQDLENQKKAIEAAQDLIDLWEEAEDEGNDALTELSSLEKDTAEIVKKLLPGEQIDQLKDLTEVLEKFGDVTDIVNSKLSALEDEQDHLAGADWFENIDQQINTLNLKKLTSLVDAVKDLTGIASDIKSTKKDFTDLIKSLKDLAKQPGLEDLGIKIDPDKINASADGIKYIGETIQNLITAYNSMSAGEQANDLGGLISNIIGAASGNILSIVGLVANVISIVTNLVDTLRGLNEQIIELNIEKFNKPVEITLDLQDMQSQWNQFRREVIDDLEENDYLGKMAQSLREIQQYYNGFDFSTDSIFDPDSLQESSSLLNTLSSHLASIMNEIKIMQSGDKSSIYGDHMADALEDLKEYTTELENSLIDIKSLEDEINEAYVQSWDYIKDELQKQTDEYERILNEIEHNKNLISMLYGDDAYKDLDKFYALEEQANSGRLQYLNQTVKYWDSVKEKMEAAGETSGDAWDKVVENQKNAAEDLNDALEDSIQTIIDKYQNAIQTIFSDITDKLTDGMGLDYVNDQWELINQRADKYLDKINSAYAIQELQAKVQDALNDNEGDLKAQEQIRDVMDEQLAYLKDKEKLTEYDVERAEKLLDIELKRIALQNAQQNKTTMRLRRDANGNYTYEYVADEDAVQSAEEELNQAQNELYNFDKDEYNSNLEEIYQMYKDYNDKMIEIASDNTLTEEERQKYLLMLNEEYQQQITDLVADNETIKSNLISSAIDEYADLYNINKENFINMTEEEKNAFMSNLVETWNSGLQQMADAISGEGGFESIAENALNNIKIAEDEYNQSIEQTKADLDGLDFTDFENSISGILQDTKDTVVANALVIETYEQMADSLIIMNQQQKEYLASIEAQNQALAEQLALANQLYYENKINPPSTSQEEKPPFWVSAAIDAALPIAGIIDIFTGGKASSSIYNGIKDFFGFDTGGYTGDWNNSNGKLAVLHEKELVLNKDDTKNILDAVNSVRDLSLNQADLDNYISNSLQQLLSDNFNIPNINNINNTSNEDKGINQTVTIEANFPDVRDSEEIKEAFDNLMNIASQRAMTNKK